VPRLDEKHGIAGLERMAPQVFLARTLCEILLRAVGIADEHVRIGLVGRQASASCMCASAL